MDAGGEYTVSQLRVLKSNAGWYVGTVVEYAGGHNESYSRESEYFKDKESALRAFVDNEFFYDGDSSVKNK